MKVEVEAMSATSEYKAYARIGFGVKVNKTPQTLAVPPSHAALFYRNFALKIYM